MKKDLIDDIYLFDILHFFFFKKSLLKLYSNQTVEVKEVPPYVL